VVDDAEVRESVREVAVNNLADAARVRVIRDGRKRLRAVLPATDTISVQVLEPLSPQSSVLSPVSAGKDWIANEFYEVRFRKGRLTIKDKRTGLTLKGANTFVDEGDRGDEYNADILPDATTRLLYAGAFELVAQDRASARLSHELCIVVPRRLKGARRRRRGGRSPVTIWQEVTLHAGVARVDFRVLIDNFEAQDHRLRALFPLPFEVTHAITENQFHVAERSLDIPPWNGLSPELPPTTFPQKTFAAFENDGLGVAIFNKGLQEGEVVRDRKGRQAYALTLLRCVGWLSRPDLASRRGGAGPTIATPDAQMPGAHTFEYSLMMYEGGWRDAGVQAMAHSFAYPPLAYSTNAHEGSLGREAPLARVTPGVVPTAMGRSEV
ncbi:MAG: glycoside hydrolase family 38 C-terminal domain-containing protein, partial [Tepidiformaceae bacterium]